MTGSHIRHNFVAVLAIVCIAVASLPAAALPAEANEDSTPRYKRVRRHVVERAKSQIGAPYRYGGTSPRGFDCSGFTRWTYDDRQSLPHSSSDQFYMARRGGFLRIWKRRNLKPGDLVFHKTTRERVGHAGLYIGRGRFISATTSDGVRVRSLFDSYWGPRWVGATRPPVVRRR